MTDHTYPNPEVTSENEAFWAGTRNGKLLVKTCKDCGKVHWYPRERCPFCFSSNTTWTEASGRGVIYAFSVMRRAKPVYTMAYVTLDEGPTMMTNLVDCDPDDVTIGDTVELRLVSTPSGDALPMFTPVKPGEFE